MKTIQIKMLLQKKKINIKIKNYLQICSYTPIGWWCPHKSFIYLHPYKYFQVLHAHKFYEWIQVFWVWYLIRIARISKLFKINNNENICYLMGPSLSFMYRFNENYYNKKNELINQLCLKPRYEYVFYN